MRFVIVTPSFGPDFERCRLLVESVKEFVPGTVEHLLLVDRQDVPQFSQLAGPRTRVVEVESVLPRWIMRVPGGRRWWLSLKTLPVRNWILQQVAKLAVGEHIDADAYLFTDSDVTLIRPFDPAEYLNPHGRLRLFRVPGAAQLPTHFKWHQTASVLLGAPPTDYFGSNYIGNMISWRRDHLIGLYRHIEKVHSRPWAEAVCRRWHLSEYILYGVYVEHVLGGGKHYYEDQAHCHISWDYDVSTPSGLDNFFAEVRPEHVAVMVSSKAGLTADAYADRLRRLTMA